MNHKMHQRTAAPILVACLLSASAFSALPGLANEPGRGSDKGMKSAQGAALTNAKFDQNERADSQSVTNAQAIRDGNGNEQVPGRGKPSAIKSARGAAVQNVKKEAGQAGTDAALTGSTPSTFKNETKAADPNPGGMMTHYPPE